MTNELPNAKIDVYRRRLPGRPPHRALLAVYFYRCNVNRPPLNDKRVRKALALSIDRRPSWRK